MFSHKENKLKNLRASSHKQAMLYVTNEGDIQHLPDVNLIPRLFFPAGADSGRNSAPAVFYHMEFRTKEKKSLFP